MNHSEKKWPVGYSQNAAKTRGDTKGLFRNRIMQRRNEEKFSMQPNSSNGSKEAIWATPAKTRNGKLQPNRRSYSAPWRIQTRTAIPLLPNYYGPCY